MKAFAKILLITTMLSVTAPAVFAQCPMCKSSVESSLENPDATVGRGLNNGILYLLAAPYLLVGAVGFMWYKKYRKKDAGIEKPNEPIILY